MLSTGLRCPSTASCLSCTWLPCREETGGPRGPLETFSHSMIEWLVWTCMIMYEHLDEAWLETEYEYLSKPIHWNNWRQNVKGSIMPFVLPKGLHHSPTWLSQITYHNNSRWFSPQDEHYSNELIFPAKIEMIRNGHITHTFRAPFST